MKRPQPKPRRRLRSEFLALIPVLALPVAIAAVFPYAAIDFKCPPEVPGSAPSCAFVALAPGCEAKALDVVRSAFSVKRDSFRDLRADLSLSTLPEEPAHAIVEAADVPPLPPPSPSPYDVVPYPPSLAAPQPEAMEPAKPVPAPPAFMREELLKID